MSSLILVLVTGVGLAAVYFLIASGLSLIYGLMRVMNFAHGALLTFGAYLAWWVLTDMGGSVAETGWGLPLAVLLGLILGGLLGAAVEIFFVQPLYQRHTDQLLVTVGLDFMIVAIIQGLWSTEPRAFPVPSWVKGTTVLGGARIPDVLFMLVAAAAVIYVTLILVLKYTRLGLIIRAGVENRTMVTALGIDVRVVFTIVFAIGGSLAALGGILGAIFRSSLSPTIGASFLIYAFIVLIIGGLGSLKGALIAALVVGVVQQFANYYLATGVGDISVVALLALVLLIRPQGLAGRLA